MLTELLAVSVCNVHTDVQTTITGIYGGQQGQMHYNGSKHFYQEKRAAASETKREEKYAFIIL